ncbi:hypothetical protein EAH79_04765 [Sphingomonas koreensis]|nr:hypothetical protein EAH79_04765 [Sphingomonas koreensis]
MGWAMMAIIGIGAAGLLVAFGAGRGLWSIIGAALMIGAIGYAVQGSPGLASHPVKADAQGVEIDPGVIELRGIMFGRFGEDSVYLTASDGLQRAGETEAAAGLLLRAIRHKANDAALWTELGTVFSTHDGGYVSPAALLAFNRAAQLAPTNPGPPFFEGLAYIRAGDFPNARRFWAKALTLAPADAGYRPEIAVRLDLLDRYIAMAGQQ